VEIYQSRRFSKAGGSLSANILGGTGQFPATPIGVERIPVSYGVEILTDDYSILSQYTHLTHRWQTELR